MINRQDIKAVMCDIAEDDYNTPCLKLLYTYLHTGRVPNLDKYPERVYPIALWIEGRLTFNKKWFR